jgi:hypothetical protein
MRRRLDRRRGESGAVKQPADAGNLNDMLNGMILLVLKFVK